MMYSKQLSILLYIKTYLCIHVNRSKVNFVECTEKSKWMKDKRVSTASSA